MDILLSLLAIICAVVGVLGSFLPIIPGPPLAYLGLLLVHWTGYAQYSSEFLLLWAGITVAVSVLDYLLPTWITKKVGGSKQATWGAAIGTILGLFIMPWGIILGPFVGAFVGELIHDGSNNAKAWRVAFGSFLAFLLGTGIKLVASLFMAYHAIKGVLSVAF